MRRLLKTIGNFGLPALGVVLLRIFLSSGKTLELDLFARGHANWWWEIVASYWLFNTAVAVWYESVYLLPADIRRDRGLSFLQDASDVAIVVMFFHLTLLTRDQVIRPTLESVGLIYLPSFFIFMMFVWLGLTFFKNPHRTS